MIICPNCRAGYESAAMECPHCLFVPERQAGCFIWPTSQEKWHYAVEGFEVLDRHEKAYFWFEARIKLIIYFVGKFFPNLNSILDVGCGTGYVLEKLSKVYPWASLCGTDIFTESLGYAAKQLPVTSTLLFSDVLTLPYYSEFDLVMACDVLEHIPEDTHALQKLYEATKPGGGLLLTVPQHTWLWSDTDEKACHVRRYERRHLASKVQSVGWKILAQTSFVSFLLPVMVVSRLLGKAAREDNSEREFNLPNWINRFFGFLMTGERALIQAGITLPLGGSLLLIAQKEEKRK